MHEPKVMVESGNQQQDGNDACNHMHGYNNVWMVVQGVEFIENCRSEKSNKPNNALNQ